MIRLIPGWRGPLRLAAGVLAAALLGLAGPALARTITIAVVRDGPDAADSTVALVRAELTHMVGDAHRIVFTEDARYDAGWQPGRVAGALDAAMTAPGVDFVLGVGRLAAQEAARSGRVLPRPFVGATVLTRGVPAVELGDDGRPAKANLALTILPRTAADEVAAVKTAFRPARVHLLFDAVEFGAIEGFTAALAGLSRQTGLELVPVPVASDWRGAAAALDSTAELVYLLPTPQLTMVDRGALIAALAARGIPTVSGEGPRDLDRGAVATFRQDVAREAARRTALNLQHLAGGGRTSELPALLTSDLRYVIDGNAAAAVGYRPRFDALVLAEIRHPEALDRDAVPLDLAGLIALADTGSVSLSISRQRTATSAEERKAALGPLLPQVGAGAELDYYDTPSVGTLLPEQLGRWGLTASQMIFDDRAISGYRQTGRYADAAAAVEEADRLDVFLAAEQGYYDLLNATIHRDVQLDNLRVTGSNLELARTRAAVGQAGQDEVFRWEAEVAKQRRAVLDAEAALESYRISLNRVLGVAQDRRWRPQPVDPSAVGLQVLIDLADPMRAEPDAFERFVDASVSLAVEQAPELRAVDLAVEAQEIGVGARQRTFFLPRVYADASLGSSFYQDPDVPDVSGSSFEARIVASLPLFEGTRRIHELKRDKSELARLGYERRLTADAVEQRTRTTVHRLRSAVPAAAYAAEAAENSRRNFAVVRDKYANGIVGITDLLDAQNARLRDELGAAAARYDLLRVVAAYERTIGFFFASAPADKVEELAARLRADMDRME
ncbi:MAG TPA: TolC family protein [Candidatus Krumholzibacteria bacterium]|nr:TolC family protein [Candidatus Krumholzibacteria bacterium]